MVQSSSLSSSLLQDLAKSLPNLRIQTYFKASLTALSHAMEDLVIEGDDQPLVIANFQQERFYRQEMQRYQRIARKTDQIYVLAAPETAFTTLTVPYATIGLDPTDALAEEWHLVIVGDRYCAALICREHAAPIDASGLDSARQFRGFWTFDANVSRVAARLLLQRIEQYRPDLATSLEQARERYQLQEVTAPLAAIDVQLFSDRLVTYLQAGQYRQVKDYLSLSQLNQQLAAIEQAQNNLIAIVGHELRTPLSTIQVCLESIATEPDMPEEFRQVMLDTALGDAERLRQLIQDFLLLSRLERGVMPWQVEPIEIGELITLAASSVRGIRKETPKISLQIPSEPLIVVCDGEALQQLLNRLIDNACKFTPIDGSVTITLRSVLSDDGSQPETVQIEIADTGCGIDPTQLEAIFEQFYQEEGFLQRAVGGAGLGLPICRRLARRMSGRLWAKSAGKGQGSQFFVSLPMQ